jgi:hypothetical protein
MTDWPVLHPRVHYSIPTEMPGYMHCPRGHVGIRYPEIQECLMCAWEDDGTILEWAMNCLLEDRTNE